MKLLLIDPVTTSKTLSVKTRKKLRQGIGYPGIGLITVAALSPSGCSIRVVDESVEELEPDDRPDLVGISVQAPTAVHAYEIAAAFRKRKVPVVLGGIHVSLNPEEAISYADAIVTGEAELTWPGLIEDFRLHKMKRMYQADGLADLQNCPFPRRDLLNRDNYQLPFVVQASKGCPYGCEFCSLHAYVGYRVRYRPVNRVIEEIRGLPGSTILFTDDNIYCNREYTGNLLEALIPLKKNWVAEASWHMAFDEEILTLAQKSGCAGLFIGFDSINQQNHIKKIPAVKNVEATYIRAIQNIQAKGIAVVAAFVFGLDNDDGTVFERSLDVILRGGANLVNFSVLVPYPGTPIFNRLKSEERITEWDWSKYISPNICYRPGRISAELLRKGTFWAQQKFYSFSNIMSLSWKTAGKLGWAMGLLSMKLNLAQKRNWGKGSGAKPE